MAGWWWKNVREDENGELHGSESWLGPVMAWDFFQKKPIVPYDGNDLGMTEPWFDREQPTRYTDKLSSIHLIGPAFDWTGYAGRLQRPARPRGDPRFQHGQLPGLQRLFGRPRRLGREDDPAQLGLLLFAGLHPGGPARRAPRRAGAPKPGCATSASVPSRGSTASRTTCCDDSRLRDSRFSYNAGLSAAIPRTPLFLSLNLEGIDRRGRFHEVERKSHELRFFYRLGVSF